MQRHWIEKSGRAKYCPESYSTPTVEIIGANRQLEFSRTRSQSPNIYYLPKYL
jgi:hypothetical protein